jgi:NAD+ kinase
MHIGLIPNPKKDPKLMKTRQVACQINQLKGTAVIDRRYADYFNLNEKNVKIANLIDCDLLICLGGDGTFLTAVHEYMHKEIPIIGVNLGSVGFLSEIHPDHTLDALTRIFKGEYRIEKRMMLHSVCYSKDGIRGTQSLALNDVVVSRGGVSRILNIDLLIDGVFVEQLPGDGIILSTPTGSTAYSLSAGGPIIQPDLNMILITPLNPHTLHNRCYIVAPESVIEIVIKEYPYKPLLTSDGVQVCKLSQSDRVRVTKSDTVLNLLRIHERDFYESLTTKIYNRGSNRHSKETL